MRGKAQYEPNVTSGQLAQQDALMLRHDPFSPLLCSAACSLPPSFWHPFFLRVYNENDYMRTLQPLTTGSCTALLVTNVVQC